MVLQVLGVGARIIATTAVRTGIRFATRSYLRSPTMGVQSLRVRYGKLSPLAKRSVENLIGGTITGYGLDLVKTNRPKYSKIKQFSMPYGYGRSRSYGRSYSRYSRYPRRYSSYRPMYRRRSYRRF